MDATSALRDVQTRFLDGDAELPNGFAEHAPMGAEAMLALGLDPAAVVTWAARHRPAPRAPDGPLDRQRRRIVGDLERSPWEDVLRREVASLAPHVGAHLFHGTIRTAHPVRALRTGAADGADLGVGSGELATALAAWRLWAGTKADDHTGPATAGAGPADPHGTVLEAARRGAGACATGPSIMTIHAVTAPMAFLLFADLLDDRTVAAAAAAFERTHRRHPSPGPGVVGTVPDAAHLTTLLDAWDAHPAKLAEAGLRGFASTGDAVFLDAVAAIMGPWETTEPGSNPPSSRPGSA